MNQTYPYLKDWLLGTAHLQSNIIQIPTMI